jgi:hypothetical protein
MPDDLDNLLRAAMKTLDEQVPSGYFEALPNRTLARLEGSSMQHGSSGTTETRNDVSPPPALTGDDPDTSPAAPREERDEDSGLHDIRNLAQSTKQRLSSRRITAQPVADDVLASSSGSFKNIALPQPAKMVSLPALDELPSKADVVAADKAAKKAAKEAAKEAKKVETVAPAAAAVATPAVAEPQPAVETPAVSRQAFALPSQQRKGNKSKTGLFAVIGIGLAAAAGAVIYMQTSKSADNAAAPVADQTVAKAEPAIAPPAAGSATITATEIPVAPPPAEPAVAAPEETAAAGAAQIAADEAKDDEDKADTKAHRKAKGTKKVEKEEPKVEQKKAPDKTEKADKSDKNVKTDGKGSGEEEPSFDALLKEAGVSEKKEAKPKLAKKKLTGSDFKAAMDGVEGKAKACYKGTVGTVMVHMTIEPDGSIKKLTVGGAFAGKPEAACVQAAMKAATFPPWDGAPQSFSYAVMLSD